VPRLTLPAGRGVAQDPASRSGSGARRTCGRIAQATTVAIALDPAADELLSRDPLALVIGMLLEQDICARSSGTFAHWIVPIAMSGC